MSATVAVGTTNTGASGSAATVTDTGTPSGAILNFTIPAGATGSMGPQGSNGAQGNPWPAPTSAFIGTAQSTGSATYTNLATVGPSVTVTTSSTGATMIFVTSEMSNSLSSVGGCAAGFIASDGAGSIIISAADSQALFLTVSATSSNGPVNGTYIWFGFLTPNSTYTVTMKYRLGGGAVCTWSNRRLDVIAFP
jgi:hypothetical protein